MTGLFQIEGEFFGETLRIQVRIESIGVRCQVKRNLPPVRLIHFAATG